MTHWRKATQKYIHNLPKTEFAILLLFGVFCTSWGAYLCHWMTERSIDAREHYEQEMRRSLATRPKFRDAVGVVGEHIEMPEKPLDLLKDLTLSTQERMWLEWHQARQRALQDEIVTLLKRLDKKVGDFRVGMLLEAHNR